MGEKPVIIDDGAEQRRISDILNTMSAECGRRGVRIAGTGSTPDDFGFVFTYPYDPAKERDYIQILADAFTKAFARVMVGATARVRETKEADDDAGK